MPVSDNEKISARNAKAADPLPEIAHYPRLGASPNEYIFIRRRNLELKGLIKQQGGSPGWYVAAVNPAHLDSSGCGHWQLVLFSRHLDQRNSALVGRKVLKNLERGWQTGVIGYECNPRARRWEPAATAGHCEHAASLGVFHP